MKEFIEYIAKHLVDNPDQVEVDERASEENKVVLALKVQQEDVGKVIGKQGRTESKPAVSLEGREARVTP